MEKIKSLHPTVECVLQGMLRGKFICDLRKWIATSGHVLLHHASLSHSWHTLTATHMEAHGVPLVYHGQASHGSLQRLTLGSPREVSLCGVIGVWVWASAGQGVDRHVLEGRCLVTGQCGCQVRVLRLLLHFQCRVCGDAAPSKLHVGATQGWLLRLQAGRTTAKNSITWHHKTCWKGVTVTFFAEKHAGTQDFLCKLKDKWITLCSVSIRLITTRSTQQHKCKQINLYVLMMQGGKLIYQGQEI